jgi:hypothetical protein
MRLEAERKLLLKAMPEFLKRGSSVWSKAGRGSRSSEEGLKAPLDEKGEKKSGSSIERFLANADKVRLCGSDQ